MNLFHHAYRHVRVLLLIVLALCILGGYMVFHLPVAIFPDLTIPRIIIAAEGGDTPTQNVLISVTRPIEEAVSTVPGLRLVQSETTRGSAGFTLTFAWGTDMYTTLQLVQARLAQIRGAMPASITVTAERLNPTVFPILDYSVTSKTRSLADLRNLALYTLRPRLARVPGVARVIVNGGDIRELVVTVRPDQLASHGLALSQVEDALTKANLVSAVGSYDQQYVRHLVLVSGLLTDPDSIRRVVVTVKNRIPVSVGDVADVSEGIQRRTVIATGGGRDAVLLNVVRQPEGNTVQVADDLRRELDSMRSSLPSDIILTPFYDQSQIVRESAFSVVEAIAIGGVLALIVVALFLRNVRSAIVAIAMVPLTLLITFAALRVLGMTLNIMTLGAIAIALGLVIDDAIVVVEHIFHHLEQGVQRVEAIAQGLTEITPAMLASSTATIVTFLPLLALPGVTGNFFAPLAETMIATLLISLVLALTVVPVLATFIFPRYLAVRPAAEALRGSGRRRAPGGLLNGIYGWLVKSALARRPIVLILLIPIAFGSWLVLGRLQTGFMPEFDEGAFVLDYHMPAGTSLAETDRVMRQVEVVLGQTAGVQTWSRLTGARSGSGLEITALNQGDLLVRLTSSKRPTMDEIMDDVRQKVQVTVPNLTIDLIPVLGDLIGDLAGAPSPIEVKIFGPDMDQLTRLAHEVGRRVSSIKVVVDESDGITESGPETVVEADPLRAAAAGLSTDSITAAAEGALDGDIVGSVRRGELLEPIRVRYPFQREDTAEGLSRLLLLNASGQPVPLSSVARISVAPGTPELNRENQRLMVSVTARLSGLDLGAGVRSVKAKLRDFALPPGYSIEYGGLYKSQQESFGALGIVLITAAVLVFSVLVFTFRAFRVAFSLFAAAVLSLSGVALALWITGTPLNISSYTGAIMIVGIVTENGVLLFDEFERRNRDAPGAPIETLLREAGQARLRPILMTTCAAILTLFPLALGIGAGAAMQKPLAIAVIGGLILSTLFTLLVAPVIYASLSALKRRLRKTAA
jgi:CzcA family heavy metal efflux pump